MASPIRSLTDIQVPLLTSETPHTSQKTSRKELSRIVYACLANTPITESDRKTLDTAISSRNISILSCISIAIPEGRTLRIGTTDHTKKSLLIRILGLIQMEELSPPNPLYHLSLIEILKEKEEIIIEQGAYRQTMDRETLYAEAGAFANQDLPKEEEDKDKLKNSYELYAAINLDQTIFRINIQSPNILRSIRQVAIRGLEQFPELPTLYALLGSTLSDSETIEWPAGSKKTHTQESLNRLARQKQVAMQMSPPVKTNNPLSKITGWFTGKTQK